MQAPKDRGSCWNAELYPLLSNDIDGVTIHPYLHLADPTTSGGALQPGVHGARGFSSERTIVVVVVARFNLVCTVFGGFHSERTIVVVVVARFNLVCTVLGVLLCEPVLILHASRTHSALPAASMDSVTQCPQAKV
jgi:hypothetical protein